MDNKPQHSRYFWLSLDQMIKYLKGNLLGEKKTEVDDQLMSSELLKDAVEGLEHVQNTRKLPGTIDELNRQIALKSGMQKTSTPHKQSASTTGKGPLLAIAASVVLIASSTAIFWWLSNTSSTPESNGIAQIETEKKTPNTDGEVVASADTTIQSLLADNDSTVDTPTSNQLIALLEEPEESFEEDDIIAVENADLRKEGAAKARQKANEKTITSQRSSEKPEAEEVEEETLTAPQLKEENAEVVGNYANSGSSATPENTATEAFEFSQKDAQKSTRYQTSPELDAVNIEAEIYNAAKSNFETNQLKEAEEGFSRIEGNRKSRFYDDAVWHLGLIYAKQGNTKDAKKMFKKLRNSSKYQVKAQKELDKL